MNQTHILAGIQLAFEIYRDEETQISAVRKAALVDGVPYLAHPLGVMTLLAEHGAGEDNALLVAGLLHDALENHGALWRERIATLPEIGADVLSLIEWVTDSDTPRQKPPVEQRRGHTLASVDQMPLRALALLLADKINSLQTCVEVLRWHSCSTERWEAAITRYLNKFQPGFIAYQHALTSATEQRLATLSPANPEEAFYTGVASLHHCFLQLSLEVEQWAQKVHYA